MDNFKGMTDKELALHIVAYINRIEKLMDIVSDYMQGNVDRGVRDFIRAEYKSLKQSIRDDAHWVNLSGNRTYTNSLYDALFVPSISEAAALGFTVATNGKIDYKLYSALEDAHYKLTKYYSLDEWEYIAYK